MNFSYVSQVYHFFVKNIPFARKYYTMDFAVTIPSNVTSPFCLSPLEGSTWAIMFIEVLTNLVILPVSFANFWIVWRTKIIHQNLKFIILIQCLMIIAYALLRIVQFSLKMGHNYSITYQNLPLFYAFSFFLVMRDFVGAIFLFERIYATIYAKSYEMKNANPLVNFFFLSIVVLLSLVGCYFGIDPNSEFMASKKGVPWSYAVMCSVTACLILWFYVYKYNCNRYATIGFKIGTHDLSERYQLSENIRTCRQLTPTIILHGINDYITIGAFFLFANDEILDGSQKLMQFVYTLMYLLFAFSNLFIEISIITFHPTLHRYLYRQMTASLKCCLLQFELFSCWKNNQVQDIRREAVEMPPANVPKTINGKVLINGQQCAADDHFKMLQAYWA